MAYIRQNGLDHKLCRLYVLVQPWQTCLVYLGQPKVVQERLDQAKSNYLVTVEEKSRCQLVHPLDISNLRVTLTDHNQQFGQGLPPLLSISFPKIRYQWVSPLDVLAYLVKLLLG
jgi:hypothetical protein